jgi:hypothetical protein
VTTYHGRHEAVGELSQSLIPIKLYDFVLGMMDSQPAYKLDPRALAYALNMRVDRGELKTALGRSVVNSTAMQGATTIQGIAAGQRTDGTDDVIVATNSGYWKLAGNTKTLISKYTLSAGCSISADLVSADGKLFNYVSAGDAFYLSADGSISGVPIGSVSGTQRLVLTSAYGGGVSGAWYIWDKQTNARTRIRKYRGRWFFANGTGKMTEWDPSYAASGAFRDVGMPSGLPAPTVAMSGGGSLDTSATYKYWVCEEDARGRYGNPGISASITLSGANKGTLITFNTGYSYWTTYHRIYRTTGGGSTGYYLARVAVSATEYQDGDADSALDTTEALPTLNYQPVSGVEDFIFFDDHLFTMRGSEVRIMGLPPLNDHAGDPPGLYQPEYDPGRAMYLGRDSGAQQDGRGFFILNKHLYALQSDSLWKLRRIGWDPDTWYFEPISLGIGCESQWTVAVGDMYAYWLGKVADRLTVLRFDGEQIVQIGRSLQGTLDTITAASACAAGIVQGYYRLSLDGTKSNYGELEWNTDTGAGRGAWCLRSWNHRCYAASHVSGYAGGDAGIVYKLEDTLNNATSAMTYQVDFAAVSEPAGSQSIREYLKKWRHHQLEIYAVSGLSAGGLSGYYSVDKEAMVALSGYPISASNAKVKIFRGNFQNDAQGRDIQARITASGTNIKFTVRGLTLKANVIPTETMNSTQGSH